MPRMGEALPFELTLREQLGLEATVSDPYDLSDMRNRPDLQSKDERIAALEVEVERLRTKRDAEWVRAVKAVQHKWWSAGESLTHSDRRRSWRERAECRAKSEACDEILRRMGVLRLW